MIGLLKLYITILLGQLKKRDGLALSGETGSLSRAGVARSLGRDGLALSGEGDSLSRARVARSLRRG